MIRALRDAAGAIMGWAFQCFVNTMWPKRKDEHEHDSDGEQGS